MTSEGDSKKSFWLTLPGILAGSAAFVTAMAGLLGILVNTGFIDGTAPSRPAAPSTSQNAPTTQGPTASIIHEGIRGAVGSVYDQNANRLVFVEFSGNISSITLGFTPQYET